MLVGFLRAVRYRYYLVVAVMVVVGALGGLYYMTAPPEYRSTASLYVTEGRVDSLAGGGSVDPVGQAFMPSYEQLFTSTVVLDGAVKRLTQESPEARSDLTPVPREKWIELLRKKTHASSRRRTNIIDVQYSSGSPVAAAAVVRAVLGSYVEFIHKHHKDVATEVLGILQGELKNTQQRLDEKNREFAAAKRASRDFGINPSSGVLHPDLKAAVELGQALVDVQKKRVQLESLQIAVHASVRSGGNLRQHLLDLEPVVGREMVLAAMGMSQRDTETVTALRQQLVREKASLRSLQQHLGPQHPKVAATLERINGIETYLADMDREVDQRMHGGQQARFAPMIVNMVQEELATTRQHEVKLQEQYDIATAAAIEHDGRAARLAVLEREVEQLQSFAEVLIDKMKNIEVSQNQTDVRVSVVTPPGVPETPVAPNLSKVVLVCLVGGLFLAGVVVYVLDVLDDRFRSPEELTRQLGAPVLAMIRQLPELAGAGSEKLHVHVAPDAVESEAFRTLRTALAFSGEADRLVVSSPEPGDGKTTVIANLAASHVQAGKRVLLIDADLRRPGLSRLLDLKGVGGLSDILRAEQRDEALYRSFVTNVGIDGLDIIPCGPRAIDPAELLCGGALPELLAWAESRYDVTLVDSPPVLAASDSAVIGRLVDGLLLVVQPEKNNRQKAVRAAQNVRDLGVNLLGLAVNRLGGNGASYFGDGSGYGYGYGYGYGHGYGYGDARDDSESDGRAAGAHGVATRKPGGGREQPNGTRPPSPAIAHSHAVDADPPRDKKGLIRRRRAA